MKRLPLGPLFLALAVALVPSGATAQTYLALEGGYSEQTFYATYTYTGGAPPDHFVNQAAGVEGAAALGIRTGPFGPVTLDLELKLAASSALWSLQTVDAYPDIPRGGASALQYRIPLTLGAGLRPSIPLFGPVALVIEGSAGWALVDHEKSSTTSTRYDESTWTPFLAWGGGLRVTLSSRMWVEGLYRRTEVAERTFSGVFPDGLVWESVSDAPRLELRGLRAGWAF